jgi:hypothetical protein
VAAYTYTGEVARTYPTLGITVEPGDSVDLDEAPDDGRWRKAGAKGAAKPAQKDGE